MTIITFHKFTKFTLVFQLKIAFSVIIVNIVNYLQKEIDYDYPSKPKHSAR